MKREKELALLEIAHSSNELELSIDADIERLWVDEAQRRYDAYLEGELEALPGDEVMARARSRVAAKCL
jgi:hypothetical protein